MACNVTCTPSFVNYDNEISRQFAILKLLKQSTKCCVYDTGKQIETILNLRVIYL